MDTKTLLGLSALAFHGSRRYALQRGGWKCPNISGARDAGNIPRLLAKNGISSLGILSGNAPIATPGLLFIYRLRISMMEGLELNSPEYILIVGHWTDMPRQVNEKLAEGYCLYGTPFSISSDFAEVCQAMLLRGGVHVSREVSSLCGKDE